MIGRQFSSCGLNRSNRCCSAASGVEPSEGRHGLGAIDDEVRVQRGGVGEVRGDQLDGASGPSGMMDGSSGTSTLVRSHAAEEGGLCTPSNVDATIESTAGAGGTVPVCGHGVVGRTAEIAGGTVLAGCL